MKKQIALMADALPLCDKLLRNEDWCDQAHEVLNPFIVLCLAQKFVYADSSLKLKDYIGVLERYSEQSFELFKA